MKLNLKEFRKKAGLKLKDLRETLDYDHQEMARYFGVTVNGYRKNETGLSLPGPRTLSILASSQNISMDWFLFDKGPQHPVDEGDFREMENKVAAQQITYGQELDALKEQHRETLTALQEELLACKQQLDAVTIEAKQNKDELEAMKSATKVLLEMTPDMREMLEQMLQNRTLKHHLLLQFSSFIDEQTVKPTRKTKKK